MQNPSSNSPIGIFDSGLGGLSVMKAVRELLPSEDLVYVGDCKFTPYGDKSNEFIIDRAVRIADFLFKNGCKALVVACNTATAIAVPTLREKFEQPIIGIEPAVKPAIRETKTGAVGVMATTATIRSPRFNKLVETYRKPDVKVILQACKGLADAVEKNNCHSPETAALISKYIEPFKENNCDKIVLGCTHYPFVADLIRELINDPGVELINPSHAVAQELKRRLAEKDLLRQEGLGANTFYVTGKAEIHGPVVKRLWGEDADPILSAYIT